MHSLKAGFGILSTVALVAALAFTTIAASAAEEVPNRRPVGFLDAVVVDGAKVHVAGWAADPTSPQRDVTVDVYVDGDYAATTTTDIARPDVTAAYPAYSGSTGYNTPVGVPGGTHEVCAFAIDQDTLNTRLGCRTVTIDVANRAPVGFLDAVVVDGTKVHVAGWAADPTSPQRDVTVDVYVDGDYAATTTTDIARPDVTAAYPAYTGTTGYNTPVGVPGGTHRVCAFAIDQDTLNTRLGCRTVTIDVPNRAPVGFLDAVVVDGTKVHVAGWAADPTSPQRDVYVDVYVDGDYAATTTTDIARPDVTAAYPAYTGTTGYNTPVEVAAGTHRVCAFAIDQDTLNTRLGCRTVTIGS